MVATPGTIPALTPYQPGALLITGQEAVEIVSSRTATAATSGSMLITDVVGKAPSALPNVNPGGNDLFAFFQVSTGLPKATSLASLGVPSGNVAAGGVAGQIYMKNSAANFDANFTAVIPGLTITNLTSSAATVTNLTVSIETVGTATVGTSIITNLTATNLTASVATVTNLNVTTTTIGSATITNLTATNLTSNAGTVASLTVPTLATVANLVLTAGTATNLFISNLTASIATIGLETISTAAIGTGTITNLAATNATISTAIIGTAVATNILVTNLTATNATVASLTATNATAGAGMLGVGTTAVVINTAAISTAATTGFLYLPSCAGVPTGTPVAFSGRAPVVVDTTDSVLYFYNSGWLPTVLGAGWSTSNPTVTAGTGTFTSVNCTMRSKQVGKVFFFSLEVAVTTVGTASGDIIVTMPVTSQNVVSTAQACLDRSSPSTAIQAEWSGGSTALHIHLASIQTHDYAVSGFVETT